MAETRLEFVEYERPNLGAGKYSIHVETTIETPKDTRIPQQTFSATRSFTVAGPRYSLLPEDIVSVFPPEGSSGGYADALPHVLLSRTTLPWQRTALAGSAASATTPPWLVLLLFSAEEAPAVRSVPLRELSQGASFSPVTREAGEDDEELVAVIDVKASVLQGILPAYADLPYLAHVRRTLTDGAADGEAVAVITGNRLPLAGVRNIAHLVSVEGRYTADGFDFGGASGDQPVRLVTLQHWLFETSGPDADFLALLGKVANDVSTLKLKLPADAARDVHAATYASAGYVPLPHHLRRAQSTVSWYHGPFVTAASTASLVLPADASDSLLLYDPDRGLFDASYAAAWELGRLLALQDQKFSTSVYEFKRLFTQRRAMARQMKRYAHLPLRAESKRSMKRAAEPMDWPEDIEGWLAERGLLRGVPFGYLVPDARMLPPDSLRFFWVDNLWIRCLIDGALSLARYGALEPPAPELPQPVVTGFLLRSEVVSGWPELQVEATGTPGQGQTVARPLARRLLSDDVLLLLFAGQLESVSFHLRPDTLHFGVQPGTDEGGSLSKSLRSADGSPAHLSITVPARSGGAERVIDVHGLAAAMQSALKVPSFNPAAYAFQMIEAVSGMRFTRESAPG